MIALHRLRHRSQARHMPLRRTLLVCGIVAFPLFVATDAIAARRYKGYRSIDLTISELSAIDAPTRSFWLPLAYLYNGLMLAFGIGVWASAGPKRALRAIAILAAAGGLIGFIGWPFAPMHKREVLAAGEGSATDALHLVFSGVSSLLFILSLVFGTTVFGKGFRRYSLVSLLTMLVAGTLTASVAPRMLTNGRTPWLGIFERIAFFSPMLWHAILAIGLLRDQGFQIPRVLRKP